MTRRITRPFAVLFRPVVVAVVLVAFLLSTGWVLSEKGLASATHQAVDLRMWSRPRSLTTIVGSSARTSAVSSGRSRVSSPRMRASVIAW